MTSIRNLAIGLVAGCLTACMGERGVAPSVTPPETTLGSVTVAPHNVVMAVGQTLPLSVNAQTLTGIPITDFDSVKYVFINRNDTLRVRVSATGVLTGLAATAANSPAVMTVLPFKNGFAKSDDVIIQVTTGTTAGLSLSIQPVAPDSAKLAQASTKVIVPRLQNTSTGQSVTGVVMRLAVRPTDSDKVLAYTPLCNEFAGLERAVTCQRNPNASGQANRIVPNTYSGKAWIYARANVYGTDLVDSVEYTFSPRYSLTYNISNLGLRLSATDNVTAYLSPTGTWRMTNFFNTTINLPIDVVFDDPAGATATTPPTSFGGTTGNVVGLGPQQQARRRFNTPGTYKWTATVGGNVAPYSGQSVRGTIIVQP